MKKRDKEPGKLYSVVIPIRLITALKKQAKSDGIPQRDLVRQFVEKGLDAK